MGNFCSGAYMYKMTPSLLNTIFKALMIVVLVKEEEPTPVSSVWKKFSVVVPLLPVFLQ